MGAVPRELRLAHGRPIGTAARGPARPRRVTTLRIARFDAFAAGRFDDGGSNLYVNAKGEIERIHRTDLTGDGVPDIVIPNTHGSLDRGPTRIFRLAAGTTPGLDATWDSSDLPNESGWLSRAVDL